MCGGVCGGKGGVSTNREATRWGGDPITAITPQTLRGTETYLELRGRLDGRTVGRSDRRTDGGREKGKQVPVSWFQ